MAPGQLAMAVTSVGGGGVTEAVAARLLEEELPVAVVARAGGRARWVVGGEHVALAFLAPLGAATAVRRSDRPQRRAQAYG